MKIKVVESKHWEEIKNIYQLGIDSGVATFETAPPEDFDQWLQKIDADNSFVILENGILQVSSRFAGRDLVETLLVSWRCFVDKTQQTRYEVLFQIVVNGGVHLGGKIRQKMTVVAHIEFFFMRKQGLELFGVKGIEFLLQSGILLRPTAGVYAPRSPQAIEDELLIEFWYWFIFLNPMNV